LFLNLTAILKAVGDAIAPAAIRPRDGRQGCYFPVPVDEPEEPPEELPPMLLEPELSLAPDEPLDPEEPLPMLSELEVPLEPDVPAAPGEAQFVLLEP
jgi:hypothetical protein